VSPIGSRSTSFEGPCRPPSRFKYASGASSMWRPYLPAWDRKPARDFSRTRRVRTPCVLLSISPRDRVNPPGRAWVRLLVGRELPTYAGTGVP